MKNEQQSQQSPLKAGLVSLVMCACLPLVFAQAGPLKLLSPAGDKIMPLARPQDDPGYWPAQRKASEALMDRKWLTEQWTPSDTKFAQIRASMEKSFAADTNTQMIVTHYETTSKLDPTNVEALFAWGYAFRLATTKEAFHVDNQTDYLNDLNGAIAEARSPHSYNYDRLRYMLWFQQGNGWASHYMIGMGQRLLKRDPNDFPIQIDQAMILTQNDDSNARQQGFAMIQHLLKHYPTKPAVYDALACWYDTDMYFTHKADDYTQALAYYQKAYDLYPVTSARRAQIPGVMQYVHKQYHNLTGG